MNIDWMNIVEIRDVAYKHVNDMLKNGWRLIGVFQYAEIDNNSYGSFQSADVVYIMARFGVDDVEDSPSNPDYKDDIDLMGAYTVLLEDMVEDEIDNQTSS